LAAIAAVAARRFLHRAAPNAPFIPALSSRSSADGRKR